MNILVTLPEGNMRDSFIPGFVQEQLEQLGGVTWNETGRPFTKEELCRMIQGKDILLIGWGNPKIDNEVLQHAEKIKMIIHTGGSVAPYVDSAVYEKGIKVVSANENFAESVAEGVIAYMLTSLRQIPYYSGELKKGVWHRLKSGSDENKGLLDRSIGIVGYGAISKHLVKMLQPFRAKIKVSSRTVSDSELAKYNMQKATREEIFKTCDIITVQLALNEETTGMISRKLIESIKDGALLINTARGPVVDEKALIDELRKNRFEAVLDVYNNEPLEQDSELLKLDNLLLMPHMAGPTLDRRGISTSMILDDVKRYIEGKPLKYEVTKQMRDNMTK